MSLCHAHNLNGDPQKKRRYGIRVRLTAADPLYRLLGGEFERTHWFESAIERDRELADMAGEHLYSRRGDVPTLRYEAVERS